MNCSEFDREFEQLVETRGFELGDAAVTHVAECPACRQRWNDHRLIDAALAAWRPVQVPASLAESVLARLDATRAPAVPRRSTDRSAQWMVVAAAACVVAVLTVGLLNRTGPAERLAKQTESPLPTVEQSAVSLAKNSVGTTAPPPVEVASSVAAVLDDLRSEYRDLALETSVTARDFALVLPAAPLTPWADRSSPPQQENSPGEVILSSQGGVPPGTVTVLGRSIGTQIGQAMDFLWVALPDSVPRG